MKKILLLIFMSFLLSQCISKRQETRHIVKFNDKFTAIIDSFITENNNYSIYELYVNKIAPDSIVSILFAGNKGLTDSENEYFHQKSNIIYLFNGVQVQIYSGIERYLFNEIKPDSLYKDSYRQASGICWTLIDINNTIRIEKNQGVVNYPFFPLPMKSEIEFTMPEMIDSL
ncbi:hypothetical protein FACS189429_1690 [Bacteroidia bacterium]|nr:hypothetical protein FACS189429_1690 [Bacteroidia bacterium]